MRFRSVGFLGVLSGCALFDAAGDAKDAVGYRLVNIPELSTPTKALVANLDNTGRKDLVVLLADRTVKAALGDASGAYTILDVADDLDAIGVGNVDNTPTDEIVVGALDVLTVWVANGNGGFEQTILDSNTVAGATPLAITTGDFAFFYEEGRSIVVTYVDRPEVRVLGSPFANPMTKTLVASGVGVNAGEVVAANVKRTDLTTDPEELIVVDGTMLIEAEDQPSGEFQSLGRPINAQPVHVAAGEFGSDPAIDIAFSQSDPEAGISIVFGSPSGIGVDPMVRRITGRIAVRELVSGRYNGDQRADLAVLTDDGELHMFLRSGEDFVDVVVPLEPDHPATFMSTGDLDADGRDDFVLVPGKDGGVDLLLSR